MQEERKILKQYDTDSDGRLDATERKAARAGLAKEGANRQRGPRPGMGGPGGPGGPGNPGGRPGGPGGPGGHTTEPGRPGEKVSPSDVAPVPGADLYEPAALRTLFLDFESADWEQELADFNNTDVEVPARLTVDGKSFAEVGVHFRGMSSFGMVGAGSKRSLNVSMDAFKKGQALMGKRTLNLLNSHEDPSFLRAVLYSHVANQYLPMPRANLVRVVINGENWGVYVNYEQFNRDFMKERFGNADLPRWKVPGSPGGRGSLAYLGEDVKAYKGIYVLKSKENPKAWEDLVRLTKVLNQTPVAELPGEIEKILDVEGALRFLALENVLINNDGYWVRSSDYSLCQDGQGRFHVIPHDVNETFSTMMGPMGPGGGRGSGRRGGPGGPNGPNGPSGPEGREGPGAPGAPMRAGGGVEAAPLMGLQDASRPLLSKLLAVPGYRTRYLRMVGEIAATWLDWGRLGPVAQAHHDRVAAWVAADTRKLDSTAAFESSLTAAMPERASFGPPGGGPRIGLKTFAEKRRAYLLGLPEVKEALAR